MLAHTQGVRSVVASQRRTIGAAPSELEQLADDFLEIPRPRGFRSVVHAQLALVRRMRWIKKHVDVVHANGLTEAVVALPLAFLARIPVVVWVHNWELPRSFVVLRHVIRLVGRHWRWLAVSGLARDLVVSSGVVTQESVVILPNPVDPAVAVGTRESPGSVRICFLAGTDRVSKGFDLIGPTAAALGDPTAKWIVFTSSPFQTNKVGWERLFALPDDLYEVRGRVPDIADALAECDIVFAPSRKESFNRVIAEAMTNGLPVVASDLSVHLELLGCGEAGVVFEGEDPSSAADALRPLVKDRALRDRLGRRGREMSARFAPDRVVGCLLETYAAARSR